MNGKAVVIGAATLACALGASLVVAPAASARDRALVDCSRGSMMQVDLEREGRKYEVDIEIYAKRGERWNITIGTPGRVVHRFSATANQEGELNAWRYMSRSNKTIVVNATSPSGETCRATVRG
jgi:hypothetical protein